MSLCLHRNRAVQRALYIAIERLTAPYPPWDLARLFNPAIGGREIRGKVIAARRNDDQSAVELTIKPGMGFVSEFMPGQFVGLGVNVNGRWQWRSYSLTHPPKQGKPYLTFYIKRKEEGVVSGYLIDSIRPGNIVRLALPAGDFILPDPLPEKILFITTGSGITPVMAMLRSLLSEQLEENPVRQTTTPQSLTATTLTSDPREEKTDGKDSLPEIPSVRPAAPALDIIHIHSERQAARCIFHSELQGLEQQNSGYKLVFVETEISGRVQFPQALEQYAPDWQDRATWACGRNELLQDLAAIYAEAGIPEKLHVEKFHLDRTHCGNTGGTVCMTRKNKEFYCKSAQSILEASLSSGVYIPSGCRIGICRTCMLHLDEGQTVDLENGKISYPGQRIRTCVSSPLGNIYISK